MISPALLGLDPATMARMPVPEARRLARMGTRAAVAIGASAISGGCLAWMAGASWTTPVFAVGAALFTWNLVRLLVGAIGAPGHRGVAAIDDWRPGGGGAAVLACLGAVLAQPVAAGLAGAAYPSALAERRQAMREAFAAAGVGGARLETSPLFAARVQIAWEGALAPVVTFVWMGALALPALSRRWLPEPTRAYERLRVEAERGVVAAAWAENEARIVSVLSRWPTFSGALRPTSQDPPFGHRPLLLGRARGTVLALDVERLREHVPGYDEGCTPGGRARALAGGAEDILSPPAPELDPEACRAALAQSGGDRERGLAHRALARALLPRGGDEASHHAEVGLAEAERLAATWPRDLIVALDVLSATNPSRAAELRSRAFRLAAAAWSRDPIPRHALDLAALVTNLAARAPDPITARAETEFARGLAEEAARRGDPHAAAVLHAIDHRRAPPVLVEVPTEARSGAPSR